MSGSAVARRKLDIVNALMVELASDEGMKRFIAALQRDPVIVKRNISDASLAGSVVFAAIEAGLRTNE